MPSRRVTTKHDCVSIRACGGAGDAIQLGEIGCRGVSIRACGGAGDNSRKIDFAVTTWFQSAPAGEQAILFYDRFLV